MKLLIIILTIISISLLAACQGGGGSASAPAAPKTAAIPAPANRAAPTPAPTSKLPDATPGAFADVPGRILFAGDAGFSTVEPARGKAALLVGTSGQTYAGAPAVSPDGRRVVYSLYDSQRANEKRDNATDLYVMNADGGDQRLLLAHEETSVWLTEPSWTPDGQQVYFTRRNAQGDERIDRINADGSGRATVIPSGVSPTVAPTGGRLAYLQTDPQAFTQDLFVAQLDGSNPVRLVGDPEFSAIASPRFSPDGQRIAFVAVGGPERPANERALTAPRSWWDWLQPPVAQAHGIPYYIWTIRADGTDLRRLTNDLEVEIPGLAWSPDGKWVAFTGDKGLFIVGEDGRRLRYLAKQFAVGGMDWVK